MGALAKIEEAEGLNEQQARFVKALQEGASNDTALKAAGYSDTVLASNVLRSAAVRNAILAGCEAELRGDLKRLAVSTMRRLMESGPPATAFNAAKFVLEYGEDGEKGSDKPLSEMTPAELERFIDGAKERLTAGMIDVTPDNGAHR